MINHCTSQLQMYNLYQANMTNKNYLAVLTEYIVYIIQISLRNCHNHHHWCRHLVEQEVVKSRLNML